LSAGYFKVLEQDVKTSIESTKTLIKNLTFMSTSDTVL
jgi:hypothetical protein